jgi:hypothetical protein
MTEPEDMQREMRAIPGCPAEWVRDFWCISPPKPAPRPSITRRIVEAIRAFIGRI